ncbi:MAG: response regulator, partial [Aminobacteriaceae bacterium]
GEAPPAVLVAEDSITSRALLKNILTAAGYAVHTAADGQEAWETLSRGEISLVVSDVEMPGMNGFELTSKIRSEERLSDLPVILVTSLESAEDRERGVVAGADAYIVKSGFDQGALLDVIRRLL